MTLSYHSPSSLLDSVKIAVTIAGEHRYAAEIALHAAALHRPTVTAHASAA